MTTSALQANPGRRLRRVPVLVGRAVKLMWAADRRTMLATAALQILGGLGAAGLLLVGRHALATILGAGRIAEGVAQAAPGLTALAGLWALMNFITAAHSAMHRLLAERTIRFFNERILEVAGAVDLEAFESPDFYDRLQRARENGVSTPLQISLHLPALTGGAMTAVGITAALAAMQPLLVPIVLAGSIPLWVATSRNSEEMYSFSFGHTPQDRIRQHLSNLLVARENASEVRAFSLAGFLRGRWGRIYDQRLADVVAMVRRFLRRSLVASLASTAITALSLAGLIVLLVAGRMDPAAVVAAVVAIQQLGSAMQNMGRSAGMLYESALYLEDYTSFLEMLPAQDAVPVEAPSPFERLEIQEVSFAYPGSDQLALDGVSMEIRAGEVIALVGENGSGKTTLAKLLCQLYRPREGRILWDGEDTARGDPEAWRKRIAVIFQDFVRYRLPASDNVTVGDVSRAEDREAIVAAAARAGAHQFLEELPNGYETILGKEFEGGTDLSVGQWQRVALARAFFRDAPFIVLDEPTASLDARAEHELFESIRTLAHGRAVLLISHRFSTVRSADRIYVLHNGRIVEQGAHAELMALGGRYAEMFTLQAASYVDAAGAEVSVRTSFGA